MTSLGNSRPYFSQMASMVALNFDLLRFNRSSSTIFSFFTCALTFPSGPERTFPADAIQTAMTNPI
eukprot:m.22660 g.22660  ORF g.22660 m.22660 type:complete len:66 (+) comp8338_c0_seq1:1339-1536(+)